MNVFLASHISDLAGPTEALLTFLVTHRHSICAVLNPLEYCENKSRVVVNAVDGVSEEKKLINIRKPAFLSWCIDAAVVFYYTIAYKGNIHVFIGCDPLNAAVGVLFKALGKVDVLVYYSVDWSEKRFSKSLINRIYYFLDDLCLKKCTVNWCVSESLVRKRIEQGALPSKVYLLPVGLTAAHQHRRRFNKYTLVFLGALEQTKGIELVLDSWKGLKRIIPQASLVVIGKTPRGVRKVPYEEDLRELQDVSVRGVLAHEEILELLPSYGVGLAPYSSDRHSVTRYADPSRIKDYLATALPVITTAVPSISRNINEKRAGVVIGYNKQSFIDGVMKVTGSAYPDYRKNAVSLAKNFSWDVLFTEALRSLGLL